MTTTGYEVHARGIPDVERGVPPSDPTRWLYLRRYRGQADARGFAAAIRLRHGGATRVYAYERNRQIGCIEEIEATAVQRRLFA